MVSTKKCVCRPSLASFIPRPDMSMCSGRLRRFEFFILSKYVITWSSSTKGSDISLGDRLGSIPHFVFAISNTCCKFSSPF